MFYAGQACWVALLVFLMFFFLQEDQGEVGQHQRLVNRNSLFLAVTLALPSTSVTGFNIL